MNKQQSVFIDIPTASISLTESFPNDPNFDIHLNFKSKHYQLQKNILIPSSKYFQRFLTPNLSHFQVKADFNEQIFDGIISVLYGNATGIERLNVPRYYQVAKFLEIDHILQVLLKDMIDFFDEYDTFEIMKLAHEKKEGQLFEKCFQSLQSQSFEQMKYYQLSLLDLDTILFKLIVKSHNIYKKKTRRGLTFIHINKLIKHFCESHGISSHQMEQMKVELMDVSLLSATEFKEIMMDPLTQKFVKINRAKSLNQNMQTSDIKFKRKISFILNRLKQINYSQDLDQQNFKQTNMYLENIYLKKYTSQLDKKNKKMQQELHHLKEEFESPRPRKSTADPKLLNRGQKFGQDASFLKVSQNNEREKKKINQFFSVIDKLSEQFQEKIQQITHIVDVYQQKKKQKGNRSKDFCSSEHSGPFLSSNSIHEMMVKAAKIFPIPKIKNGLTNRSVIDSIYTQVEETASNVTFQKDNKINFENIPISLQPQSLPALYNFIRPEGFKKINLHLIFRRSRKFTPIGNKKDLFNRDSILVIFKTKQGIEIGGYVSCSLAVGKDQISDQNAFVFNLKKAEKLKIIQPQIPRAFFISDKTLINFADDLVIPNECLNQKSSYKYSSYQIAAQQNRSIGAHNEKKNQQKQNKSITILDNLSDNSSISNKSPQQKSSTHTYSQGLGLSSQFQLLHLQIFQVRQAQMQMLL